MSSDVAVATGIPIILESIIFFYLAMLGAIFNHPLDHGIFAFLKFIYSEKVTKFCEISTNYLSYVLPVK